MPYNRPDREFRDFVVVYGLLERKTTIEARSSLEAAAIFMDRSPGEIIHDLRDTVL